LVGSLPSFAMVKHDFAEKPSALYSILQDFRDTIEREGLSADATDGIVVTFHDGWVHVRASQTESMIRVIAEAGTAARARGLADWARDRLGARG
jgi:phosphomannomutase